MKEHVIKELVSYAAFKDGWDGPGSIGPSKLCLQKALDFAELYPNSYLPPTPMIGGRGYIGFYWDAPLCYVDIEIDNSGETSFFMRKKDTTEIFMANIVPDKNFFDGFMQELKINQQNTMKTNTYTLVNGAKRNK